MIFGLSRIYVIGLRGIWIMSENVGVTYRRVRSTSSHTAYIRLPNLYTPLCTAYRILSLLNNHFNTFPLSLSLSQTRRVFVAYREIVPLFFYKRRCTIRTFYSAVSIQGNVRYYASVSRDNFRLHERHELSIVASIRNVRQVRGKCSSYKVI